MEKSTLTETESGETCDGHWSEEQKSMLIIWFAIKGIVRREFAQSGQTVNSTY
jgi:hypothetical protein